ncbi:MAG: undecaprenyl/decaprenyl-phosphate alpha-N-acetylglucosaminyl 1-phosphate transferase [Chitinophagaceae bacterium]|nr:MAG: undecaprenyl/decaprenyl-phosphate alpha-N-acetylglucosaminyl 1-phosphate transferase [Chitinophagaceae bacterium]
MLDILLTAAVSFIITFLAIPIILTIADQKKLFDIPDERKLHTHAVASLGGVGIFAGFVLAALLAIEVSRSPEFQYYFAAAFVIFFLGLKDDLIVLSATKKFIGQLIAAAILIHLGNVRIDSMHGFLGIDELPLAFSYALSYLTIILVINSFNLIDGVDGLAASLGIMTMLVFGTYFYMAENNAYALLSYAMCGSLVAFLIFNHHPAKIFMGDSGSLMIGLVASILVIRFINVASVPGIKVPVTSVVAVGISVLFLPLADTLRVFAIRIFNGRSPFTPDRNHIHHLLLARGLNHAAVTLVCLSVNIAFLMLTWSARSLGSTIVLIGMASLALSGIGCLYYLRPRKGMVITRDRSGMTELKTPSKVVTLVHETVNPENN